MNAALVELSQVGRSFVVGQQRIHALREVDHEFRAGEKYVITGRSGAGKTTLLHLIGLLDRPTTGRLLISGVDTSLLSDAKLSRLRNQMIGFIFQASNLLSEFSAMENVLMPAWIAGRPDQQARALSLLAAVGLQHRAHHRPSELSGGEQQRVAIARALMLQPPLLLADEPTGNLDRQTSAQVQDLIFDLCDQFQTTLLVVTHDEDLAARFSSHIVIEDGKLSEQRGAYHD